MYACKKKNFTNLKKNNFTQQKIFHSGYRVIFKPLFELKSREKENFQEFQNGIGGKKPAKLFTRAERGGKNKHKYHRRKVVWECIEHMMVDRGYSLHYMVVVIVYTVYCIHSERIK